VFTSLSPVPYPIQRMTEASVIAGGDSQASPDSAAFHRFLNWLDGGSDSDGRSYLEMRRRLVAYFDRKNCLNPDELADETLSRVARRLAEEGEIDCETPAKYCYIVARFVFLESLRSKDLKNESIDDIPRSAELKAASGGVDDEREEKERMLACLDKCGGELEPANRDLIFRYYLGEERVKIENRRSIAAELGISVNALSIRACRIRDRLEACVRRCCGAG
jgi:DNA-directed RNA polymerase specialized sigma24 family protein